MSCCNCDIVSFLGLLVLVCVFGVLGLMCFGVIVFCLLPCVLFDCGCDLFTAFVLRVVVLRWLADLLCVVGLVVVLCCCWMLWLW